MMHKQQVDWNNVWLPEGLVASWNSAGICPDLNKGPAVFLLFCFLVVKAKSKKLSFTCTPTTFTSKTTPPEKEQRMRGTEKAIEEKNKTRILFLLQLLYYCIGGASPHAPARSPISHTHTPRCMRQGGGTQKTREEREGGCG